MSYRPLADVWLLARPKLKGGGSYHGSFPAGFLHRARALLGVSYDASVLHICGGKVRDYPYRGLGPDDKTLDLDPECKPDFLQDCREDLPLNDGQPWDAVLIDRPYTEADAAHYAPGAEKLPALNDLLKRALMIVPVGGRVGVLDYLWGHPGKFGQEVAVVAVGTGRNGRARWYCVYEKINAE